MGLIQTWNPQYLPHMKQGRYLFYAMHSLGIPFPPVLFSVGIERSKLLSLRDFIP